jgi:serine/threonine protein kinase
MSAELSAGQAFGAYHIVGVAGSGGMGVVYRAEQRSLGRIVALKVLRPEVAESGDYRSRFLQEARLAAAVNDPHVVSVFDVGEYSRQLYLSMQWVDGTDLHALIDRQQLDPERTVRIGRQQAKALQAVHEAGFVHRDVKPSNVLVRDIGGQDHSYLTDFGIAKVPDAQLHLTRTGWAIGTSGYMSPEQIRGEQLDPRSDLYALGCIIFEALTGQRPFGGGNDMAVQWAHAYNPRPVASALCPALGPRYDAFLAQALAIDPQDRFPSGRAFAAALHAAHAGRGATQTQVPAHPYVPTRLSSRPSPQRPGTPAAPPAPEARPPGTPEPTVRRSAARPTAPAAAAAAAAAAAGATATALPPASRPKASPAPPNGSRSGRPKAARAGQLVVLAASAIFIASVALLNNYVNNGTGWKSLREATHNDPASPLVPHDFWLSIALAGLAFVLAALSVRTYRRLLMIGAVVASLGLIGYTVHIPFTGTLPGFGPYGPGYWLSLAAAGAMVLGAGAAAAARSTS